MLGTCSDPDILCVVMHNGAGRGFAQLSLVGLFRISIRRPGYERKELDHDKWVIFLQVHSMRFLSMQLGYPYLKKGRKALGQVASFRHPTQIVALSRADGSASLRLEAHLLLLAELSLSSYVSDR